MSVVKDTFKEPMFLWTLAFLVVMFLAVLFLQKNEPGNLLGDTTTKKTVKENKGYKQYDKPPKYSLKTGIDYQAEINTSYGSIKLDLLESVAPNTVNNFVFLAKDGFYNNLLWHRVVNNILIQTGDPKGDGTGGPGYYINDEININTPRFAPGIVGMANAGPNTNGSQFFIVASGAPANITSNWDGKYTVFAKVLEGQDVVDKIARVKVDSNGKPVKTVKVLSIRIFEK